MNTILLAITFTCGPIYTENRTEFEWNKHDEEILSSVKKRCPQLYKDAPCVGKFIKTGKQDYQVLCTKATSFKDPSRN